MRRARTPRRVPRAAGRAGPHGQDRASPSLETALKLGDRTLRLADQLLLTPRARSRAGIDHVPGDDDFLRELGAYVDDD